MAGGRDDFDLELAKRELIAILQQAIKVAAVWLQVVSSKLRPKDTLDLENSGARAKLRPRLLPDMIARRQMVGMDMGFERPKDMKAGSIGVGKDPAGRLVVDLAARYVETEDRVDDRSLAGRRIRNQVAHAVGGLVKVGLDARRSCGG